MSLRLSSFNFWIGALLALSVAGTAFFAPRTYDSFVVLRSAAGAGPHAADIRPWMTVGYVATVHAAPLPDLLARFHLPAITPPDTTLGAIARSRGADPLDFISEVRKALAELGATPAVEVATKPADDSWGAWVDDLLSALLAYRYEAFALVLLLGAIGLPVPTGFSTVLAGSLIAGGQMEWIWASAVAVIASLLGDAIGYGIGLAAHERFLARYGRFLGYTERRKSRIQDLFDRWGGLTVLLTRTLVSHLSSVASLLAGISRYSFAAFAAFALIGRIAWTSAYMGLGYIIGDDVNASGDFLAYLSGLLLSLGSIVVLVSILLEHRNRRPTDDRRRRPQGA